MIKSPQPQAEEDILFMIICSLVLLKTRCKVSFYSVLLLINNEFTTRKYIMDHAVTSIILKMPQFWSTQWIHSLFSFCICPNAYCVPPYILFQIMYQLMWQRLPSCTEYCAPNKRKWPTLSHLIFTTASLGRLHNHFMLIVASIFCFCKHICEQLNLSSVFFCIWMQRK